MRAFLAAMLAMAAIAVAANYLLHSERVTAVTAPNGDAVRLDGE